MQIGLALSGGGFRATLYHLGVVRYLRDAGLLDSVSHVTSVSGGSVLAAHLVLNWHRYTGTAEEFDDAAQEILDFVRMDIRNRIVRRYPFMLAGGFLQRVAQQRPSRAFSRTGSLARHYRNYLYGDTCLYELPKQPELHILCTNLSEGGLSSFTRHGLLYEERSKSGTVEVKTHRGGLTPLALAVAASSAFPGFFPPLELTADDIGATEGEFQTQFFTDGGVYDNLGVRMFRYLERRQKASFAREDFANIDNALQAWNTAVRSSTKTPLRRLTEIHASVTGGQSDQAVRGQLVSEPQVLLDGLERLVDEEDLAEDPELRTLVGLERKLEVAATYGNGNGHGHGNGNGHGPSHGPGAGRLHDAALPADRLDRNRDLIGYAFREAMGEEFRGSSKRGFDAIIASDAGKKFEVTRPDRAGTFLRTAMRSSDILMDRVWQLEKEHFADSTDCVFIPITRVVKREEDPTAPHPEVQIQVSRIRTDMDRFSDREVSGLVRHGYCVARQVIATRSSLQRHTSAGSPWSAVTTVTPGESAALRKSRRGAGASFATQEARDLQRSSRRSYVTSLLSPRDWVSYIYVPLAVLLLIGVPWSIARAWRHIHVSTLLTNAIAETRQDYNRLLTLIKDGPVDPWTGMEFVDADHLDPLFAEQGLDIIADTRITDLRMLSPQAADLVPGSGKWVYAYRLVSVRKIQHASGPTGLKLQSLWDMPNLTLRCHNPELKPELRRLTLEGSPDEEPRHAWQLKLDFSSVPVGHTTNVIVEAMLPADPTRLAGRGRAWWEFEVDADPEVATSWVLLPEKWKHSNTRLVRYENANPENPEIVEPTHQASILEDSILNWIVVHPRADHTYTYRWGGEP